MIPALFITQDCDIETTVFCLTMMARNGMARGIRWLIAVQSNGAIARLRCSLPAEIDHRCIRTPPAFGDTFAALAEKIGSAKTVFFALSDRYPIKPVEPQVWDELQGIAQSMDADALRLCHWREGLQPVVARRLSDGTGFRRTVPRSEFGSWHPQFVSRRLIDKLLERTKAGQSLQEWQRDVMLPVVRSSPGFLVPDEQITVYEEPTRNGREMIHYAMRAIAGTGRDMTKAGTEGDSRLDPITFTFTSNAITAANRFHEGTAPDTLIARSNPSLPYSVHSLGGTGSKMLVRWLYSRYPDPTPEILRSAHCHWRLPPVRLPRGQTMIYVFGNPIDSVLSFFSRRHERHERDGFGIETLAKDSPMRRFALSAQENVEAAPEGLTMDDDRESWLRLGTDVFRVEEHLNNHLYGDRPYPILFLRYEALWKHEALLHHLFPGQPPLPAYVSRASGLDSLSPAVADGYNSLYGASIRRLERLPDVFVAQGGQRHVLA